MNHLIVLDFDGVIADTAALKKTIAERMLARAVEPGELSSGRIEAGKSSLTLNEYRDIQNEAYTNPLSIQELAPYPESLETIALWTEKGVQVRVVTARTGDMLRDAERWLVAHGTPLECVGVGHNESKVEYIRGANVFVDDDPRHVRDATPVTDRAFLMRAPHNDHDDSVRAINSLADILLRD